MGSLINGALIAIGGIIGVFIKKGLREDIKEILTDVLGILLLLVGLVGIIPTIINVNDSKLVQGDLLLLIISMIVGAFFGQLIDIDKHLNNFGMALEKKLHRPGFSKGFIAGSIFFCVGAMAIVGSLTEGLTGDPSVLVSKSIIDFVTAIILASTLGYGVIFASIPIILYEGGITLLAGVLQPFMTELLINQVCMVGYAIIFCIGINFLEIRKIKTANLIPALIIPVIYYLIMKLF
ncbi:MAG: DUF554 domain-containing protein [Bacilli bacterium]|nr:DUF554 domain-containing protein [Bacilli bacterium]